MVLGLQQYLDIGIYERYIQYLGRYWNLSTIIINYRIESFEVLRYSDENLSKSSIVLIVTWMVRFSVSTNDGVLVTFEE